MPVTFEEFFKHAFDKTSDCNFVPFDYQCQLALNKFYTENN